MIVNAATAISSAIYSGVKTPEAQNVATLLSPKTSNTSLNQGLLSALNPAKTGPSNESLVDFIKENVPNNEAILADLAAVNALANLTADEASSSSLFYNNYSQLLLKAEGKFEENLPGENLNALI